MKQIITESIIKKECHDCGSKKNLIHLIYEKDGEIDVFKCKKCYKDNSGLQNYQKCEVYSRICGYIRPVQSSNAGKRQEISERKTFKV